MKKREYSDLYYYPGPALLRHGLVGEPLFKDIERMKQLLRDLYIITEEFYEDGEDAFFAIKYDNDGETQETTGFLVTQGATLVCFDSLSTYAFVKFIKAFLERFPDIKYLATSVADLHSKPLDLSLEFKPMMDLIDHYEFDEE